MMLNWAYLIYCLLIASEIDAKSTRRKGVLLTDDHNDDWKGPWFPHAPGSNDESPLVTQPHKQFVENVCDDGVHSIGVDYAPSIKRNSYHTLCLTSNRTSYDPNLNTEALLTTHFIPPAYVPPVKCLNETINYDETLPTFGGFRPLAPKYGSYKYLPPQRWLHSLARGAIVMLYHPCAFTGQVVQLQNTVKSCLYRHIISPSQLLTAKRPLAVLAWGKSLEMSVVDEKIVVNFIKEHSKGAPLAQMHIKDEKDFYETDLLSEAHLITDVDDVNVCGFKEM